MRLILLGGPGSGKGTQAKLLAERLGLEIVGTGDIIRDAIRLGTPYGRKAEPFVTKGQLVPDNLVNQLVGDRFSRPDRPERFVLDGYPRTLVQAQTFDQVLRQQFLDLTAVVYIEVSDDQIVHRLGGRWICPKCGTPYHKIDRPPKSAGVCDFDGAALIPRVDDQPEAVRERLRLFHITTADLIPYYRDQGLLREVSGEASVEQVYQRIMQALRSPA
jgi:adenylate kinase